MNNREDNVSRMEKKKLGIIGGVGPAASAFFYNRITEHTEASCDQEHLDILLFSHATLPDRTAAIKDGNDTELVELLRKDVKMLESLGAANIAIPCNTSHYFFDKVQSAVSVPLINMIHESVRYAAEHYKNVQKIGIMATDGTIQTRLYHKECESFGIIPFHPSKERQIDVMSLIYDDIKRGKAADVSKFSRVMEEFTANGCDVVILACTELSVYAETHDVPDICLDAMDVLVRESIRRSGATYK